MYQRAKSLASYAEHRRTIELVAHGLHPETGEPLHTTEIIHDSSVVRALFSALDLLRSKEKLFPRREKRPNGPPKAKAVSGGSSVFAAGNPWSRAEDEKLRAEFRLKVKLQEIASLHGRTSEAIAARLVHLGLSRDRAEARRLLKM